jgi:hypothetical protein
VDANGLQIKIDSKGVQQDLAALSKMFDKTAASAEPDAFCKASGSIQRDQNRTLKRSATRNLTGT